MGVVQAHFRPEFINRLDELVVFRPHWNKRQIRAIARIQTGYLAKRLAERQLKFAHFRHRARPPRRYLGFDPVYGARPLKRAIQQQLENPLAREILEGRFQCRAMASQVDMRERPRVVFRTRYRHDAVGERLTLAILAGHHA